MLMKGDEDAATISTLQKKIRELEAKIEELEEDLESERATRKRVSAYIEQYSREKLLWYSVYNLALVDTMQGSCYI